MKKLTGLTDRFESASGEEKENATMPQFKTALSMIANIKARTADDARRTSRLVRALRSANVELEVAEEDVKFLRETFEANPMNLFAHIQGQILERLDATLKG